MAESSCSEVFDIVLLFLFLPEREIFLEELDDGLRISESLFVHVIDLFKGIRQSLLSKFARLLVVVHDFVMEDGEVQRKSKSNGVAGIQGPRRRLGVLVVFKSSILHGIKLITLGALSHVSVVITDHLVEESFGLISGSFTHARTFDNINNGDTLVVELLFDFLLVSGKSVIEFGILWVLLNGADGSNGSSL